MKEKTKIILAIVITFISTLSITALAVFRANASNITFSSDKTDKDNVEESLNELYDMASGSYICPNVEYPGCSDGCLDEMVCLGNVKNENATKKCIRAKNLHVEKCVQTNTSYYCSSTDTNYNGTDIVNGSNIVYGNTTITDGVLKTGDAFTCDVNGDGIYDEVAERFYYVSDYYDGNTNNFDADYAILIYYNNTTKGVPDNTNTSLIAYNSYNVNNLGPVTGVTNLPSTTQWNNVSLKSQTRQIRTQTGTTSTSAGTISTYTYTDKAARLITVQEISKACGSTIGSITTGEIDIPTCRFLMENTKYSNTVRATYGYWLETSYAPNSTSAGMVSGSYRRVSYYVAHDTSNFGIRPVIEVLKTDIAY